MPHSAEYVAQQVSTGRLPIRPRNPDQSQALPRTAAQHLRNAPRCRISVADSKHGSPPRASKSRLRNDRNGTPGDRVPDVGSPIRPGSGYCTEKPSWLNRARIRARPRDGQFTIWDLPDGNVPQRINEAGESQRQGVRPQKKENQGDEKRAHRPEQPAGT